MPQNLNLKFVELETTTLMTSISYLLGRGMTGNTINIGSV